MSSTDETWGAFWCVQSGPHSPDSATER